MDLSAVEVAETTGPPPAAGSAPRAESAGSDGQEAPQQAHMAAAPIIPLDVVLESEEFCADYVGLHPRGFGQGELITTPSTIRKPDCVYVEDLCQSGCPIKKHRLCTQTDMQLIVLGPHVRVLCEYFVEEALASGQVFNDVAKEFFEVRLVFFDSTDVVTFNPATTAMEVLTPPQYYLSVTPKPYKLVVNVIRRGISQFISTNLSGRPFRFEVATSKVAYIPASKLREIFKEEVELYGASGTRNGSNSRYRDPPSRIVDDPTTREQITPFVMRQLPNHPTTKPKSINRSLRGPLLLPSRRSKASEASTDAQTTSAELFGFSVPPVSPIAQPDPSTPCFALRLRLQSHLFLLASKNPDGRTEAFRRSNAAVIGSPAAPVKTTPGPGRPRNPVPAAPPPAAVEADESDGERSDDKESLPGAREMALALQSLNVITETQLWHLRPFRPTSHSVGTAYRAFERYVESQLHPMSEHDAAEVAEAEGAPQVTDGASSILSSTGFSISGMKRNRSVFDAKEPPFAQAGNWTPAHFSAQSYTVQGAQSMRMPMISRSAGSVTASQPVVEATGDDRGIVAPQAAQYLLELADAHRSVDVTPLRHAEPLPDPVDTL